MAVDGPPEAKWPVARLFPTVGIKGQKEQERRAASVLLAVVAGVPEFGRSLLKEMRAPKGRIATFTEIPLKDKDGRTCRPDGAIVVTRGRTRWSCLVEIKTGKAPIDPEQIESYLDVARLHGFDGVLTISNQIRSVNDELPYRVSKVKVGKLALRHSSWWRILTQAIMSQRFEGIEDQDQDWILSELIEYLDHPASGASGLEDMGEHWVTVRTGARHDTLRKGDAGVIDIAGRWAQYMEYLCLHLSQHLGVSVIQKGAKGTRLSDETATSLVQPGTMKGAISIPDSIGTIEVCADLRTRQLFLSTRVPAPEDRRAKTRITWLSKQLDSAPENLTVEAEFPRTRMTTSELLLHVREAPTILLHPEDPRKEARSFRLTLASKLGLNRGTGSGSFITDTLQQVTGFYGDTVQPLKLWRPKAPRLQADEEQEADAPDEAAESEETGSVSMTPRDELVA